MCTLDRDPTLKAHAGKTYKDPVTTALYAKNSAFFSTKINFQRSFNPKINSEVYL
jgi:hypothetical protein